MSFSPLLKIRMQGCRDCVHILRSTVDVLGGRIGLDALELNRVALAVDELYANIVRHSYCDEEGPVEFEAGVCVDAGGRRGLRFLFRDYAPPLPDTTFCCKKGDVDDSVIKVGGLGMHLICSVMDVVRHEALADGNSWLLGFRCEGEGDESGA